jgi:soluble lytic murein transglycosylase
MQHHPHAPVAAGLLGLVLGLALGASRSASEVRDALDPMTDLPRLEVAEPARALPRTRLVVAMEEARASLAGNRPWAAWSLLRDHVEDPEEAPASAALLAARAAAAWGGWGEVRALLRGQEWLGSTEGGEGWYLLGRAEEEGENWERAAAAYHRYLALPGAAERGTAQARLGRMLSQAGRHREAAAAFGAAAERVPAARDWLRALQAEALAKAGSPEVVTIVAATAGSPAPARVRQSRAEARFWLAAGDTVRALDRLEREGRALAALGARTEAAALTVDRARLLVSRGRLWEARDLLRAVAADSAAARDDRVRAAQLLGEAVEGRSVAEEMARAAAFEAAGKPGLAAKALRGALAAGAPDDPELRLRIGRLLYEERDLGPARASLLDAAERLGDPERAAEAELLASRARVRAGDREGGLAALRRLAERRAGTAAAGTALFLLGDASANRAQAIGYYRRAAATRAPEAREALYRVGDRSLKAGDTGAALRAWEEYVERWPRGEETARAAYRAGVLHERAGRKEAAAAMYAAAMAADPVSYYALRAGERAGADALERPLRSPATWVGLAPDLRDASSTLARLDALESLGLEAEWEEELEAAKRRLARSPAALLVLAEGLRDRGHTVEGIRLGRRLVEMRGGEWDARLLRVVFPYPYREIVEEVAAEMEVDPALLAGLVRQESSFNPRARSWVGATGLSQIMPSTGAWIAPRLGIYDFRTAHLTVPEVNLEMGGRYLRDQLRRYEGARDLALAAYNAGPGRADRWRRELGYGGDVDAFREKIPFTETRHYVQLVLRNAAVYRRLYGRSRSPGLVDD